MSLSADEYAAAPAGSTSPLYLLLRIEVWEHVPPIFAVSDLSFGVIGDAQREILKWSVLGAEGLAMPGGALCGEHFRLRTQSWCR